MKYFVLILLVMSFIASEVHANYAYANAGVGYYGGTVPCPYGNGGIRRGKSAAALEARLDMKKDDLEDAEDELDDLYSIDSDLYDDEKLPLTANAAEVLRMLPGKDSRLCPGVDGAIDPVVQKFNETVGVPVCEKNGNITSYAVASTLCENPNIYNAADVKRFNQTVVSRRCERWLKDIKEQEELVADLDEEIGDLEEDLDEAQYAERKAEKRAEKYGYAAVAPEGVQCLTCGDMPEPKGPSGWQIAGSALTDIAGAYLMYRGYRYVSDQNAALGWDTSPLALGAYYPHATSRLYGAYRGGGQGAGSWGCAQTMNGGYPNGANGIWGPNGPYSQYGNAGGPFYAPQGCGYGCVNPYAGSGPFMPGIGPWGAAGPWGSNGVFPYNPYGGLNAYANLGINLGGGNPFGGGPFGGSPFGGLYGQGGLGLYGQGQFGNPFGGPFGGNPFGGQFGNPFGGGIFGGGPFGGNPFGGGPFGGNPFGGGGLGMEYQMQLMQMQMQQQQAMYQAQQRALQNQMVVSQQVYGLQMEYQQLMQRYQRIMQYSSSGYLGGGNISIYGGLQFGSYNPFYTPPGSNISNPPNGDSPTGR